jgi:cytoskeletal protein CcmA (bactofilin family)
MKKSLSALIALGLIVPSMVLAQEITKDQDGIAMMLGNDMYAAGNAVNISRNIEGDVNIAGNTLNITGIIGGDVHAAGSQVLISGNVEDDMRVFGNNIVISGNVGGDVIAFGNTITIAQGATISGNLLAGGANVNVDGNVNGDVRVSGETVSVSSEIGGSLYIDGQKATVESSVVGDAHIASNSLSLNDPTRIQGDLRYWNEKGSMNTAGKVMGSSTFDPSLRPMHDESKADKAGALAAIIAAVSIVSLLYAALTITVFMLVTRTFFIESAKRLNAQPGMSLLIGLGYFFLMPFAIILLMLTVIGIPLGLAALAFYILSIIFAKVIAAIILARLTEIRMRRKWHWAAVFGLSLLYYIILKLIMIIPFVGWAICFFVVVATFGSFEFTKFDRYKKVM